nr:MAG TPA: hypothetical protein [Caudovirales sp. ctfXb19]
MACFNQCRAYVVLLIVKTSLILQGRLHAVKEKLNHGADGLIVDGPADEPAVFAGAQSGPEHLDDPRFALCASLGALNLLLGPLDEVKHQRLYRCTIAQPDAAKGVENKAAQHQHCRHRGGNDAQNVIDRCHVLLSSLFFVVCFEVCNAVVCHFDLFFKYRDALGKVVVHSHLPGQLFQLCVRDRLLLVQLGVHALGGVVVGDDRADQAQTAGDNGYDDCFAHAPSRRRVKPFLRMILG